MMKFNYLPGATPLDLDEAQGLIPPHITTHTELNEWENANILAAEDWVFSKKHKNIFTIEFMQLVHKKMFNKTWRWAGKFRTSNKNIGIDYPLITTKLYELMHDVISQIQHHSYPADEIAYRFHHRLVFIHPFANGNGRHARMMADVLVAQLEQPRFTWGSKNLVSDEQTRKQYIKALKSADKHDYRLLSEFVRT